MTGPNQGQIDVAIQSLREDAQRWRAAAGELQDAATVAGQMDFQAFHFSYLGDKIGVTDAYRALQDKLIDLLNGGATNFRNVAEALTLAAEGYEQDERNAVHRLRNVW
jgi:hypothetical protein